MTGYCLKEGWFYRDGSSVKTDFLKDKYDNSNLLLVGPSGSGKTVNITDKLMDYEERYDLKIVFFDFCGQYELLHKYLASLGKSSTFVELNDSCFQGVLSPNKAPEIFGFDEFSEITTISLRSFVATFGNSNAEHSLANIVLAVIDYILDMARKDASGKDTIIVMDEAQHYIRAISKSNLMPVFSEKITELNNEGVWLWMAAQTVVDMPVDSSLFIGKFEFVEILSCGYGDDAEIEAISKLKDISDTQKAQITELERKILCYVEGVFLNRDETEHNQIYRYCPSSLAIVLCGTDPYEKAERLSLMKAEGVSELEALQRMTHSLDVKRWGLAAPYLAPDRKPIIIDEPVHYVVKNK